MQTGVDKDVTLVKLGLKLDLFLNQFKELYFFKTGSKKTGPKITKCVKNYFKLVLFFYVQMYSLKKS